jgi:hypothetical protein
VTIFHHFVTREEKKGGAVTCAKDFFGKNSSKSPYFQVKKQVEIILF